MFSNLENLLISELKINKSKKYFCIVDNIKIYDDFFTELKLNNLIFNTQTNNDLDSFIFSQVIDRRYKYQILLSQNHFTNFYIDLHFILDNPNMFNDELFEIIYRERQIINKIPNIINTIWNIILNTQLKYFYNITMIEKWLETMTFNKISDKNVNNKYLEIWDIFDKNVKITTQHIQNILEYYKQNNLNHKPGMYNIDNERLQIYKYFCSTHTGINNINLDKLYKYAQNELDRLEKEFIKYALIILKEKNISVSDENKTIKYIANEIKNIDELKFKNEQEYIDEHIRVKNKYEEYYIKSGKLKQLNESKIVSFNDKNKAGGYWFYDTFYLNTMAYKEMNKSNVESLVLHETIPGHHTQINYFLNSTQEKGDLLLCIFNNILCGTHEGWGLFSEKLGINQTNVDKLGRVEHEILRTLRIIVDIDLHKNNKDPEEIIKYMSDHLIMPLDTIRSEVFRYLAIPGQALCYKTGLSVYDKIFTGNLTSDENIQKYNKYVQEQPLPLELLIKKYNITLDWL